MPVDVVCAGVRRFFYRHSSGQVINVGTQIWNINSQMLDRNSSTPLSGITCNFSSHESESGADFLPPPGTGD